MKLIYRLARLKNYLCGDTIVLRVANGTTEIDSGFVNTARQHQAAVDFFHKVYTQNKGGHANVKVKTSNGEV